jgi:PAS domain S-box-containing protein
MLPDGRHGVVCYFYDMTERQLLEAALRESEGRFRALAEMVPQMVWFTSRDGLTEYFNVRWEEYTGLSQKESLGNGWAVAMHPDDLVRTLARWEQATATGEPYEIEYRIRGRDGEYRWFLGRALPVRDASGEIVRWFGTCTDIEEVKRAEEALVDADRRKDEFLATLAHELRNPLAPIRAAVQLMGAGPSAEEAAELRETIDDQVSHLTHLIEDLLDVSRITRNRL